jgi:tetratricopeptide (TPR) repeat protein
MNKGRSRTISMKNEIFQSRKIGVVLDGVTVTSGFLPVGDDMLAGHHAGHVSFYLFGHEKTGIFRTGNITACFISDWSDLYTDVLEKSIERLLIIDDVGWNTTPSVQELVYLKAQGVKIEGEGISSAWTKESVAQLEKLFVYTGEVRLRLISSGVEPKKVKVVPRWADFQTPLSRKEQGILRRGYGITEQPLLYMQSISKSFLEKLSPRIGVLTSDKNFPNNLRIQVVFGNSFEQERSYLRMADFFLFQGNGDMRLLREAVSWGIPVYTTQTEQIEDYFPLLCLSRDEDDSVRLINATQLDCDLDSLVALKNNTQNREEWFFRRSRSQCEKIREAAWEEVEKSYLSSAISTISNSTINELQYSKTRLRVLLQNRPNAEECPGGDTVVMNRFAQLLRENDIEVVVDHSFDVDYRKFDLVHLFNFALPDLLEKYAKKVKNAGKPFVVTALNEDIPSFLLQSQAFASQLIKYVKNGQPSNEWNEDFITTIGKCDRFKNDWVAFNAAMILCSGVSETATVKRDYPGCEITEIPFGIESNLIGNSTTMLDVYNASSYVLCVGRLEFRKNQLGLLKALENSGHTIVFATGGFSYSPDYAEACRTFKRKGENIFLDRLSEQDLADVFAGAQVHVLPSWYELPGLVSLEAARHGCEIVATDRGTTGDYFENFAHYCIPWDTKSILRAVDAAFQTPRSLGLRAHVAQFNWQLSAKKLIDVYYNVLSSFSPLLNLEHSNPVKIPVEPPVGFFKSLHKGESAAKVRDYPQAEKELKNALDLDPTSARCLRALGAIYLAQKRNEESVDVFERALTLEPGNGRSLSGLGMGLIALGRFADAHGCLVRSALVEPFELVTMYHLMQTSYQLQNFDDLISALRRYTAEKKEDIDMLYCLAGAFFRNGNMAEAEESNNKVLLLNKDHIGALELKKELYKTASGTVILNKESKILETPSFDSVDLKLLDIEDQKRCKNYQVVMSEVNNLLDSANGLRFDQRISLQLLRGEALLLAGEVENGRGIIIELFKNHPQEPKVVCSYSALLCMDERWKEAQELFEKVLRINPRNDVALAGLGGCYQQCDEIEVAWQKYQEALDLNCENKRALLGVIQLGHQMQRYTQLEVRLKEYLELHPADTEFLYVMAGCLFAQDRYDEAENQLCRMAIFEPDNSRMLELNQFIKDQKKIIHGTNSITVEFKNKLEKQEISPN